jgi:hypothetical protein
MKALLVDGFILLLAVTVFTILHQYLLGRSETLYFHAFFLWLCFMLAAGLHAICTRD